MNQKLLFNKELWGKYSSENGYHPAVYHMLDVSLVAATIFPTLDQKEQKRLLRPFANSRNPLATLIFLIALHDLGKLTPGFQLKIPEWRQRLIGLGYLWASISEEDKNTIHGYTGYFLLSDLLQDSLSLKPYAAKALANSVAGHHGSFFHGSLSLRPGEGLWEDARAEAVEWLQIQLNIFWDDIKIDADELTPAYIVNLAGFCAVSDWLGSDESTFSYLNDGEYNKGQREQFAYEQIQALNLKQAKLAEGQSQFEDIFPFPPNATQRAGLELFNRTDSPVLTIIETPMGSGKTEAALAIADKYIREQGKTGFYFALPTQATGNQLFERAVQFLKGHPAKTSNLEMHLRHSNASLNAEYETLQASSINNDPQESVVASRWFTSNKRGLLSGYAVGTIDQCLIASLQVRHFFVRLFGLGNKVVVIDEVHAYTTYTSRILEGLLEWLSALDAPVILLSATLPATRRKALMSAYSAQNTTLLGEPQCYPRISCLGSSGVYSEVHVLDDNSTLPATFEIRLVEGSHQQRWQQAKIILDDVLANGGCAACIVNTVKDAQKLFEQLKLHYADDSDIVLMLFHARFPLYQRLSIEKSLKALFGKDSGGCPNPDRPIKAIVVATQVLEQSLDVDFDVMISVLAPVDLLLQRSGRVHRHYKNNSIRPEKLSEPTIYCLHPPIEKDTDDAGKIFGNSEAYIYEPYCLFYTIISLQSRAESKGKFPSVSIAMPDDMEKLIDEIYEGKLELRNEGEQLRGELWEFEARQKNKIEVRFADDLRLPSPNEKLRTFFRHLEKSEDDEKVALTRLALPSVALVVMHKNALGLWCLIESNEVIDLESKPDKATQHRLIRSSVRISHQAWVDYFTQNSVAPLIWQKVAVLRDCYPLYLKENVFRCSQVKGALVWRSELGLIIDQFWKESELV